MKLKHFVAKLQISFYSEILWDREGAIVREAVLNEHKIREEDSCLTAVNKLTQEYGFLKISEAPVDKKVLKYRVTQVNFLECWRDCLDSHYVNLRPYIQIKDKRHFSWPKLHSKALVAWRTGSVWFKNQWQRILVSAFTVYIVTDLAIKH